MANGDFGGFWTLIQARLSTGDTVRNWTQTGGYLGDVFAVRAVEARAVVVDTPDAANLQRVPMEDFAAVWEHWNDYCAGELPRKRLRDVTRFSKYVISILHHVLEDD